MQLLQGNSQLSLYEKLVSVASLHRNKLQVCFFS